MIHKDIENISLGLISFAQTRKFYLIIKIRVEVKKYCKIKTS